MEMGFTRMSDWDDVLRISRASDQLLEAISSRRPIHRRHRVFRHDTWYDLRGCVDEIPRLGIVFSTNVGLAGGVMIPPKETGFTHLIMLPQFFRHEWNVRIVETQTLLHHELAHILLGHDDAHYAVKKYTPDYFNHPAEMDAFFHQAVAGVVSYAEDGQFSWTSGPKSPGDFLSGNASDFVAEVIDRYGRSTKPALDNLTPQNRANLITRLHALHRDATAELRRVPSSDRKDALYRSTCR